MLRYMIIILTCFMLMPCTSYAASKEATKGVLLVTEYKNNKKKGSEEVPFIIANNLARVDVSTKVYYIINLDDDQTLVINNKRKTATNTYLSNVLEQSLPPIAILKSRSNLKKYLTSSGAHLEEVITKGLKKYEIWQFSIDKNYYKLKVLLPEFFPEEIEVSSKKNRIIVKVIEKSKVPQIMLDPELFFVPSDFNMVDLISE